MRILLRYFFLEWKRCYKVLMKSLGSMIAMLVLIALGVSVCNYMLLQTQSFQRINVGVVIPKEESQSKIIAQYLSSMDSVQSVSDFHYLEYAEAMEKLEKGELQVVLALPQNFYEDIYVGENTPATIYLPENMPLNLQVFRELFLDGVSLVQVSEAGVYASLDTARFKETQIEQRNIGDFIVTMYIETALNREEIFDKYTESPLGEINVYQYYVVALFAIFLLMSGLNFGFLYQRHGKAMEAKFRMYGIGQGWIALVKILVMAGTLWSLGLFLYVMLCVLSKFRNSISVWFAGQAVIGLFFLCLSMAAFFHIVYTIAGNGFQGTVILFAINVTMVLCSGTILPTAYFPEIIAKISEFLPLHFWQNYSTDILFGAGSMKEILTALGFVCVGAGVGVFCEWKDM